MDRGPGFPARKYLLSLTSFTGWKDQSRRYGLGLSIAKGFAEAHKGTISVENRQNGGAKFTIKIPTEIPHEAIKT